MHSTSRFGLMVGVAGLAMLALGGCGSSSDDGTGPGSGGSDAGAGADSGGGGAAGQAGAGGAGGAAGQAGAGGVGGAGGSSGGSPFDSASSIDVNPAAPTQGELADVGAKDYYTFTAVKGERLAVVVNAQSLANPNGDGYDPAVIDAVVTVFDAGHTAIAQADDAWPRYETDPTLFFEAPADGQYYFTVEDCNSAFPGGACADPNGITTFDYETFIADVDNLTTPEVYAGGSQDGTTAKAVDVPYAVPAGYSAGDYGFYTIDGDFAAAGETHVFRFTPKTDTGVVSGQRAHAEFWLQPMGPDNGDGSTANVTLWVTDGGGTVLSKADQQYYGHDSPNNPMYLTVPVTLGGTYYLYVQSDATTSNPTDYYFISHFVGSYYYGTLEAEGATASGANDTRATAEVLTAVPGTTAYVVDGDIVPGDVDWFEVDAPSNVTQLGFSCEAARTGSGLRGFTAEAFDANGTSLAKVGPEPTNPTSDLSSQAVAVTPGKIYLSVSAASQDATVTGTFYHCGVYYP